MAEIVQQNLESMIPELEQIQRVELLSEVEVKQLIKNRKKLEYRLQKREKRKEDFLEYIQYELALLALLEMRREKTGYFHKKDEIEFAIAKRINRMFRITEHRFGHEIKIWLSHIDFLKKMKWDAAVGRIYRRMLKVHVHEIGLWVAAAKYEMEECGRSENARQVMFEALRFHPKSQTLYRETHEDL
ncbi:hypothetical protein TCAL_13328 [Tigriopus californicus]|uniref:U3 small nucleolar RNA-associated protein 6 N-terminal domain-containing protein n=1 Tax=Tigriopus californicus TaxID=6832 RepID=A0A553NUX5_TIGCA|nr:hypothetical protein TCAL_13328 [Tigriopus californicus]|eukprot:TCALIF_13328-PA protein Name:"Similar to UTP6 U3 small nucleolar RNA-associated protein 6 homolog (Homo sapiens)" AED:0.01 eAED:0.01 QI:189/0.66/0.75/0.75/1/1/4/0/186